MTLRRRIGHFVRYLLNHRFADTYKYAAQRIPELYHDWRFGVRTVGAVPQDDSVGLSAFSKEYCPSDYASIYRAFRHLPRVSSNDVFLDYGCGMGRVLVVAATFPFQRIVGVELLPSLSEIARANLRNARSKARCHDHTVVTIDAGTYRVPPDVTYIFFYNPFTGPVLTGTLAAIHESLTESPRTLWIVFKNPTNLWPVMSAYPWLELKDEFPACDADHTIAIFEASVPHSKGSGTRG